MWPKAARYGFFIFYTAALAGLAVLSARFQFSRPVTEQSAPAAAVPMRAAPEIKQETKPEVPALPASVPETVSEPLVPDLNTVPIQEDMGEGE